METTTYAAVWSDCARAEVMPAPAIAHVEGRRVRLADTAATFQGRTLSALGIVTPFTQVLPVGDDVHPGSHAWSPPV